MSQNIPTLDQKKNLKPLLSSQTELEFEQLYSNWQDYNNNLSHIIQDTKIGNLSKFTGQREHVEHCLNFATLSKSWHRNPKYALLRSESGWLSFAASTLNVSLSIEGFFIKEGHTIREKKEQKDHNIKKGFSIPGFGGNKQEEMY